MNTRLTNQTGAFREPYADSSTDSLMALLRAPSGRHTGVAPARTDAVDTPDRPVAVPTSVASANGVVIGELIGLKGDSRSPLVRYAGQPGLAALCAKSVADLRASDVGRSVVLMFENAHPDKPIVMGLLQDAVSIPIAQTHGQVDVEADGSRLLLSAKEQLVLRCGKASITLTSCGKVLIQGEYVSSSSSGLNRIRGGAIQLN